MRSVRKSVVLCSSFLAGCVALSSEIRDQGIDYYLPKSILTVAVWEYFDPATSRTFYMLGGITPLTTVQGAPSPNNATTDITDTPIPDLEHKYTIKYHPSSVSDDRLCISRTTTGLLYDVQFAADDRTPQIAFNISQAIAGSIGGGPKKAGFFQKDGTNDSNLRTRSYASKIDPFNPTDIAAFNAALRNVFRAPLKLSFERAKRMIAAAKTTWPEGCTEKYCPASAWRARCSPEHICYRTKVSLPLELYLDKKIVDINYADVINAWDIGAIDVTRAFLVHKITKFRFDKGALVAAIIRKPSEVEEASLLPIHVVNAALITPSGLWAAAFSGNTKDKTQALTDMSSLTNQLSTLQTQVSALQQGTSSEPTGADNQYNIDCAGDSRGTNLINWVTDTAISNTGAN